MMGAPRSARSKIKSPAALKAALKAASKKAASKRGKARVVFTNGCFDILHKGHVNYLERARKLGDLLVVALNTDASVKRLKGPTRPINLLADRLEVMASLEFVDFVTWFDEDDPVRLIEMLTPRVLVKGGDWKPSQILGSEWVLSHGGRVKSLPYIEGRSTTNIIERSKASR